MNASPPGAAHEGLLFSASDLAAIRERTRLPLFRSYWDSLVGMDLSEDRRALEVDIGPMGFAEPLARVHRVLVREAFVYAVSGDRARGDLARLAIRRALQCPMWAMAVDGEGRPIGIQTGPQALISVCLAYDWLGDLLSDAERAEMRGQIGDKGCEACYWSLAAMRDPDRDWGWRGAPGCGDNTEDLDISRWPAILAGTNLQAVPMAALALGACLLDGRDGRVGRWLGMVEESYRALAGAFDADGSNHEGASYWGYTARHLALTVEAVCHGRSRPAVRTSPCPRTRPGKSGRDTLRGTDLFDVYNYVGMAEFALALEMADGQHPCGCVNFGDASDAPASDVGFWIARRSRDGLAQHWALNHASGHTIYSLVWYDPSVAPLPPGPREHFKHLDLDWIVARTGYSPDDLVVAMRSGGPTNHEHADRNAVIMKARGEVFLADPRRAPYPYQDPAWVLRTSPAHNTVLVDGRGHQYHDGREGTNPSRAEARIVRRGDRGDYLFWASDATPAYALVDADIEAVTRTVILFPAFPCLIVLDKLIKGAEPSLFSARWHVENQDGAGSCTVEGSGFTILRPQARLVGVCAGSGDVQISTAALPVPEEKGVYPYVEVGLAQRNRDGLLILVGCPLRPDEPAPDVAIKDAGGAWQVRARKGSAQLDVTVRDTGRLPTFEVHGLQER